MSGWNKLHIPAKYAPIKEHALAPFLHVEECDVLQQTLGDAAENSFQQATQFRSCTYYHPVFPDTKVAISFPIKHI